MKIAPDIKLDFADVLIKPQRSATASRKEVEVERCFKFRNVSEQWSEWSGVPIFAANMDTVGTFAMAKALQKYDMPTCLHKHYDAESICEYIDLHSANPDYPYRTALTFLTLGTGKKDRAKMDEVADLCAGPFNCQICIDVANGYTDYFVDRVAELRQQFPTTIIMAGNVCTPEMVQELVLQGGVDIVKIGIGPGSACSTRMVAGVGYPQLSAIAECADAAHGLSAHVCADGGCKTPSDVVKAFGAGADFVMLGGMLAGTEECDGEWEWENDIQWGKSSDKPFVAGKFIADPDGTLVQKKKSMKFYGMSSADAMKKHSGGVASYRASEGESFSVPYKGHVSDIILQVLGGIRSACAYVGAKQLKDLSKRTTFVRVNRVK